MTFKEFKEKLKNKQKDFNLITVSAVKDEHTPFYHAEYDDNHPILSAYDAYKSYDGKCWADDYIIVNPHQPPLFWASGVNWNNAFNNGRMECLIIISEENAKLLNINQSVIDFITNKCERYLNSMKNWQEAW